MGVRRVVVVQEGANVAVGLATDISFSAVNNVVSQCSVRSVRDADEVSRPSRLVGELLLRLTLRLDPGAACAVSTSTRPMGRDRVCNKSSFQTGPGLFLVHHRNFLLSLSSRGIRRCLGWPGSMGVKWSRWK